MSSLHHMNIALHIVAGSFAVLLGAGQLVLAKGGPAHRRRGVAALVIMSLAVAAAIAGAIVFRGMVDLMGVSFLVGYQLYSASRTLKLRKGGRLISDVAPALLIFGAGIVLVSLTYLGAPVAWSAPKVFATAFGLAFYGGYDALRIFHPLGLRPQIARAEHAFKMTSLVFAFGGVGVTTLLHDQTALTPLSFSAIGLLAAAAAAWGAWPRAARKAEGDIP